jgi:adrenodoxin-NADP+ reductase
MSSRFTPYICSKCALHLARLKRLKLPRITTSPHRQYSAKPVVHDGRPFRLAVIGSGPAGFYTAYKVLSTIETAKVDMYERLPVPYGLVRFGVAPDHPEVKV